MMEIKPIRNKKDHKAALAEIERLWSAKPSTSDYNKLEVLSILVDAYEREKFPSEIKDPIDAILFRMEQAGLERKDLQEFFKTRARMSEIFSRKRKLTLPMIRLLHKKLSIPLEVLVAVRKKDHLSSHRHRF